MDALALIIIFTPFVMFFLGTPALLVGLRKR
jgi:hypothetical protein